MVPCTLKTHKCFQYKCEWASDRAAVIDNTHNSLWSTEGGVLMDFIFNISKQINAVTSVRLSCAAGCDILAIPLPIFFVS